MGQFQETPVREMTRQSRKQKYTLTAKKYTLAAKKYTLTRNRCARCGARFMPPYLCRRNPTATMQAKRHIAAQTSFGKKIFRKMRLRVAAKGVFPYLRPVCWRCSPSLWQLGKNRFIRMAASAAPHGRERRFRQGWRNVRLAGSPTGQALQESVIGASPYPIRELTETTTLKNEIR